MVVPHRSKGLDLLGSQINSTAGFQIGNKDWK